MSKLSKLTHVQLPVPLAIAGGLIFAALMGTLIGSGDMSTIKRGVMPLLVLVYLVFLHTYTWQFGLLICALGFVHFGFGFKIGGLEISGMLAALLVAGTWWRNQRIPKPKVMELFCFRSSASVSFRGSSIPARTRFTP